VPPISIIESPLLKERLSTNNVSTEQVPQPVNDNVTITGRISKPMKKRKPKAKIRLPKETPTPDHSVALPETLANQQSDSNDCLPTTYSGKDKNKCTCGDNIPDSRHECDKVPSKNASMAWNSG